MPEDKKSEKENLDLFLQKMIETSTSAIQRLEKIDEWLQDSSASTAQQVEEAKKEKH